MSVLSPQAIATLEQLKGQLRKERDLGQSVRSDLYTHLTEVFTRIIQHHPFDAFEKFEEISNLVKKNNLKITNPMNDYELNVLPAGGKHRLSNSEALNLIEKAKKLLQERPDVGVSNQDKIFLTKNKPCIIPNLQDQAQMLEWAGVSFGEDITYMIQKSLKRLATLSGADSLKLFGKIYGTQKDYWIAQGVLSEAEEKTSIQVQEPRGQGVNTNVYWVTDNLLADWIQLPDARPEHCQVARVIKHVFTGNLNSTIDTCPPFPGKERHLLRAQIARISHGTELCPKGIYEIDEETTQEKLAEEAPDTGTAALTDIANWAHRHPVLLQAGRCTHVAPEGLADEALEEELAKQAAEDPPQERYRSLGDEGYTPVKGLETSWLTRVCGDQQVYNDGEGQVTYAVNVIRSIRWPGSVTVAKGGKYTSIYVGDGIKRGETSFNPTEPPEVQSDPVDQIERPEPTPLLPPEEPAEPDTDAEKVVEGEDGEDN